ncbi:MAG: hypothetical protein KAH10_06265 [Flavobacteriales bacterium]|nr:hypothetical protein [Flavobacteriales bacterium]
MGKPTSRVKHIAFYIAFFIFSTNSFSQSIFTVSGYASLGYNRTDINVWDYKIDGGSTAIGYTIAADYQYYLHDKYYLRTGLIFSQVFANVVINDIDISATSYKVGIPLKLGIKFKEKWETDLGVLAGNYKNINEFESNSSHNLRIDMTLGVYYWLNSKWRLEFIVSHMVSEEIDAYSASSYKNHILIGASYKIL